MMMMEAAGSSGRSAVKLDFQGCGYFEDEYFVKRRLFRNVAEFYVVTRCKTLSWRHILWQTANILLLLLLLLLLPPPPPPPLQPLPYPPCSSLGPSNCISCFLLPSHTVPSGLNAVPCPFRFVKHLTQFPQVSWFSSLCSRSLRSSGRWLCVSG